MTLLQGEPEDIAREKCRLAAKAVGGAGGPGAGLRCFCCWWAPSAQHPFFLWWWDSNPS